MVGAPRAGPVGDDAGGSYGVLGKVNGTPVNLSAIASGTSNLGFVINGAAAGDSAGWSVSSAGDVNKDGVDDLIVGAKQADTDGRGSSGQSDAGFGKANGHTGWSYTPTTESEE